MSQAPSNLGPFQIRREIGTGGMGVVYEGWDARLGRQVAVKTLWPSLARRDDARERFLREARAAASVSHPNVTQIYDIGEDAGVVYFAMEYLGDRSVEQVLQLEGKLDCRRAIDVARQAARGLRAAAAAGIVHRDVKPSNLVFHADGTLKVTDFGLAKRLLADRNLTLDGQTIGTPKYVSPEQASGGAVDLRSDIYSLGASLYEMVCGRPPFDGTTPMEVMLKHVRDPVPPVQQVDPAVPRPVATLIHRMLSKQPGARPQDYDELLRLLDRADEDILRGNVSPGSTIVVPTVSPVILAEAPRARSFAGRLFLLAAAGLVLLVGAGVLLGPDPRRAAAPDEVAGGSPEPAPIPATVAATPPATVRLDVRSIDGPDPASLAAGGAERAAGEAVLEIVDARHEITRDGRFVVSGEVTNTGATHATNTKVRISLTDAEGELVNSTEVWVSPQRLAEGDNGRFEAVFPDPRKSVRIVFELNWIS